MRRSPATTPWYVLAILIVVGAPVVAILLLGTPRLALPSGWPEAAARIDGGSYPPGYIVDILSGLVLLGWAGCLWSLVVEVRRRKAITSDEADKPRRAGLLSRFGSRFARRSAAASAEPVDDSAAGDPWYRQGPPIFEEQFSDAYPRVVVPPEDVTADEASDDTPDYSLWRPATATAGADAAAAPTDAGTESAVRDAEIVADPLGTAPTEPPMIVPVRAYYFTRAEDTLRSIAAQFLQTPARWQELQALNAASPGVSGVGPDTLLPVGTALALPGDPLPWGKPDPVYLWTLAEKFLFTAWGREPAPEEVVPFWRGLTSGSQLGTGTAPPWPEHLAAPEPPAVAQPAPDEPEAPPAPEPAAPEAGDGALQPEAAAFEPPAPEAAAFEPPAFDAAPEELETPPAPDLPPVAAAATASAPPQPEPPAHEPPPTYQPPDTSPYQSPVPPAHEPPPDISPYQSPELPAHEPPPDTSPYQSPELPAHEPPPTYQPPDTSPHQSPVPPAHEPPPTYQPPDTSLYESPVPPAHEPPPTYQPPDTSPYESPVPPAHEPPPIYQPAITSPHQSPVAPAHEPPPVPPMPGFPDFGPVEPEVPYVEAEAPRMPSFMPSLTGATATAAAPEAAVVASSSLTLAGTAVGDAMMLWRLSRLRRRRPDSGGRAADPLEASLQQSARVDTLELIEAAMRHLRAVTVGQLREQPAVLAVRVGTYGFEVLLNRRTQAPEGWLATAGGFVLELPQGVTVESLDAVGQGPSLCPALVPVGDTVEGPLLLNIEEIGCLIVSGASAPSVRLLNAIVGTLGSSPMAGDIRVITVGLDTPVGMLGWETVHATNSGSPQLEELLTAAHTGSGSSLDVLVVGPGNELLIQRAGQVATTPGSRLAIVGATSSVATWWPWRIHVDETTTAVVHPIACTMAAAQATAPAMTHLVDNPADLSILAPPRF